MGGMGGMGGGMSGGMGGMNQGMGGFNQGMGGFNQGMGGMGGGMGGFSQTNVSVSGLDKNTVDAMSKNLTSNMQPNVLQTHTGYTCFGCQKGIVGGEIISAMGKYFHVEHFCCLNCSTPLGTANFFQIEEGKAACEKCYNTVYVTKCAHCNQVITDQCVVALNQKWHPNHFVCASCSSPFPTGNFFEKESKPYCEKCFTASFGPKCATCNVVIQGEMINALNKQWHPACFICAICKQPFRDGTFFDRGGMPFCALHVNTPLPQAGDGMGSGFCQGCKQAINSGQNSIDALGVKWHREHFLCSFCMTNLQPGNFVEHQGKAYCFSCKANNRF